MIASIFYQLQLNSKLFAAFFDNSETSGAFKI